jgi:phospho-N-acetylmuramoyl-pentapeptide-transferase
MMLAMASLPLCFVVGLAWGPWLIRRLQQLNFGKQIRLEGQEHHMAKAGTPVMGGWIFIVTGLAAIVVLVRDPRVVVPMATALILYALFGALDDYANIRNKQGLGFQVKAQLFWQLVIAFATAAALYWVAGVQSLRVPGFGTVELGIWMLPFAVLVLLATTSGANVIDGLDGLAGGTIAIMFAAYMALAMRRGDAALAGACAAMVGAILAFLWFNVNPARVFMGGVGSLALGAGLATVALLSGDVLLLPVIGLLLVVELLSVILQVGYFKLSGGKRIFRRAPIHHHWELAGVPEVKIVFRFWLCAAVCAAVGLVLADL